MTERSFVERIVAVLGVVVRTITWVVRFLLSLLKDAVGKVTGSSGPGARGSGAEDDSEAGATDGARQLAADIRAKGESLKDEAASLGQSVAATARDKVEQARHAADDLMHRGDRESSGDEGAEEMADASGIDAPELTSVQHDDVGGIPEAPAFGSIAGDAPRTDASRDTTSDDDQDDTDAGAGRFTEGIPNLEEPGGDTGDVYGSEAGVLLDDEMPQAGYAGQVMQESDIGMDRGDEFTELAEGEEVLPTTEIDRALDDDYLSPGDAIDEEDDDDVVDEDDEDAGDIPAASRGWQGAGAGESVADELYDDLGVTLSTDEIDYANDEADADDAAGMHIVDSPDESFVVEESPAQPIGLVDEGGDPAFDTGIGERRTFGADDFAADALGNRVGGDAASGDVGPRRSPDDATWDPGSSEPSYVIQGTYDGSGVDEFASDEIATEMLEDAEIMETAVEEEETSDEDSVGGAGSVAWATSSGVIDRDLVKPLSSDELQEGGGGSAGTDVAAEAGEPGLTEKDAGLRDAAAEVADQLGSEMDGSGTSGTTMSGAGQSAGAMTSDDAATEETGADEMTSNTESLATGGTTAPEAGDSDDETTSGEGGSRASMGLGENPQFNEVLPDRAYEASVGYESLQADRQSPGSAGNQGSVSGTTGTTDPMVGAATTTGGSGAPTSSRSRQRKVPPGAVRGDGSGTCPADYPIKGNANSRIYHRPTDSSYEDTNPEFCFATESDAKAAGFRARRG